MSHLAALQSARTIHDVAALLGFKASAMAYILYSKSAQPTYKKFQIPKRGGGTREIAAPIPQLKLLQRRLSTVLQNCFDEIKLKHGRHDDGPKPDQIVHGFVRRRSILSNARQHRHRRFVFNADLKDYFPSINFGRVRGFFIKDDSFALQPKVATLLAQIACFEDALPQGSPCSPIISNLIGHILDVHLVRLAARNGCIYSRYADDITFSTNKKNFPEAIATRTKAGSEQWTVGNELAHLISASGFVVNAAKTRMQYRTSRQEVTGLVVNQKVNVSADYRRKVRAMVHHLFTKGTFEIETVVADPATGGKLSKVAGDLSKLHGMLGFIDGVDLYNRRLTPSTKGTALNTKELMYRRFLFYKDFYATTKPLLICEGKTDTVYLTHAIRSLSTAFPLLAATTAAGKIEIKIRRYRYAGRSTGRILGINGGHGDLRNLILAYRDDLARFKAPGKKHPVIILIDNDAAAAPMLKVIKQISGKTPSNADPFVHVVGNLYVVLTPLIGGSTSSMIEDFFDAATNALPYKGKSFDPSNDYSTASHYGKADFAYHVVQPNASTINFAGFAPLLTNISAAIAHHNKMHP
jgi:RNA-directed DNA polymerase